MVNCPSGHPNPDDWEFCGECGAPLLANARRWWSTRWIVVLASIVTILGVVSVAALVVTGRATQSGPSAPGTPDRVAIE